MAQLCRRADRFSRLGTRVILLTFCEAPVVRAYLDEMRLPFDLLLDPERTAYKGYGLERSYLRSRPPRLLWRYLRHFVATRRITRSVGDPDQLGGDFVVDARGVVRMTHPSHDPLDRPDVDRVIRILERLLEPDHAG